MIQQTQHGTSANFAPWSIAVGFQNKLSINLNNTNIGHQVNIYQTFYYISKHLMFE